MAKHYKVKAYVILECGTSGFTAGVEITQETKSKCVRKNKTDGRNPKCKKTYIKSK